MDLPNPPANMETIPSGSFVIPMDTINQAIVPSGNADFNLKAYGLVNRFLQNGIPVKWAIRSGKTKDAIDFSALAARVYPSPLPSANIDFIAGPFIIPDTVLPCGLSTHQIVQLFANNVAVFQLQQSVVADIRYTLNHRPKIAVFNNGGNQRIHMKILDAAAIPDYTVLSAAQISSLGDCFTFASEPHVDEFSVTTQMVNGIMQFVQNGGNFFAQCEAITSYESQGLFHTTNGINAFGTMNPAQVTNTYINHDMAAAQIHGNVFENRFGSCEKWSVNPTSAWRPWYYPMVCNPGMDTIVFSAAHMIAANASGGNVFFLGGHDYGRTGNGGPFGGGPGGNVADLTEMTRINGMRYYLNAVMIPSYNTNAAWANAGPDVTLSCGDSIALGCSQTGPLNATYSWSPSTGLSCVTCPNPMAQPNNTTTYIVTVATSCNATDTITVNVNSTPVVNVNNAGICLGDSVSLIASGAITFSWAPSTGLSSVTGSSVTANPSATTVYTITGTDQNGCIDAITATVTVNTLPAITVNSASICLGDSLLLTSNGANTYSWSPAAGIINSMANTATIQPGVTTIYTVSGTDVNGCVGTSSATVTVNDSVSMTAIDQTICYGDVATIVVTGSPSGNFYSWSNGLTGSSVSVSPSADSIYTVTGTSAFGCSKTISIQVNVNPLPVITSNDISICAGDATSLSAQGGQTYSWIADGQSYSGATILINPVNTTTYTVTGTDANGCMNTYSGTVTVNPLPVVTVISDSICEGETGSLQAAGGNTFIWQPGNLSGAVIFVSPQSTTTYNVVATDISGCSNTATGILLVNTIPVITSSNDSICIGEYGTLTAQGAETYLWMPLGISGSTFSDNPVSTTTYTVTGISVAGCSGNTIATIVATPKPVVNFETGPPGCAPLEVMFQNLTLTPGIQCLWSFGDGVYSTEFSPFHIYDSPGNYSVELIVSIQGCLASAASPKMVNVYPLPVAGFTMDGLVQDILQSHVQFHNASITDSYREWNFGDGNVDTSGSDEPLHIYREPGLFTICLYVENIYGCADSYCDDLEIKPMWSFYISNAFTPNEDDVNEGFIGKSYNVVEHQMWIYDRWGLLIYDTGKTTNPESAHAWDGKVKGSDTEVQQDVYVWKVKLKDINNEYHDLVGRVTVVK